MWLVFICCVCCVVLKVIYCFVVFDLFGVVISFCWDLFDLLLVN